MRVIGMDVHVRNSFLHAPRVTAVDPLSRQGRQNTLGELARLLAPLEGRIASPSGLCWKAPPTAGPSTSCFRPTANRRAWSCGPKCSMHKLRIIARSVSKCDKHDAAVLNELAHSNLKLPVCYMPDDEVFALREHLRARSDLVRVRTMLEDRCHAVLHRRGVLNPLKDLFGKAGRQWLGELKLDDAGGRFWIAIWRWSISWRTAARRPRHH